MQECLLCSISCILTVTSSRQSLPHSYRYEPAASFAKSGNTTIWIVNNDSLKPNHENWITDFKILVPRIEKSMVIG